MINFHAHTNYSYCADADLTLDSYADCIRNGALEAVCIVDHGMAIYFPKDVAMSWKYITDSSILDEYLQSGDKLLNTYINQISPYKPKNIYCGLEVEMSLKGRLIYNSEYRNKLFPIIGSVHFLPTSRKEGFSDKFIMKSWMDHIEKLLYSDVDILGHPFRWISRQGQVKEEEIRTIVEIAKNANIALELNGHNVSRNNRNIDIYMMKMAREIGCKISFGTDSHSIKQISDFSYHNSILNELQSSINDFNMLKLDELRVI